MARHASTGVRGRDQPRRRPRRGPRAAARRDAPGREGRGHASARRRCCRACSACVRDQVMAALFGAGFASDAFNTAFRIPNLLRDLFAEGAMSASFIPTFTEYDAKRGRRRGVGARPPADDRRCSRVLLALCVLGWIFAPQFMDLLAGGFAPLPGKLELTGTLFRDHAAVPAARRAGRGGDGHAERARRLRRAGARAGAAQRRHDRVRAGADPGLPRARPAAHRGDGDRRRARAACCSSRCQLPSLRRAGLPLPLRVADVAPGRPPRRAGSWCPATIGLAATQREHPRRQRHRQPRSSRAA